MDACTVQSTPPSAYSPPVKPWSKPSAQNYHRAQRRGDSSEGGSESDLTQCPITDTKIGLNVWSGASAELHSCAFERDGGR